MSMDAFKMLAPLPDAAKRDPFEANTIPALAVVGRLTRVRQWTTEPIRIYPQGGDSLFIRYRGIEREVRVVRPGAFIPPYLSDDEQQVMLDTSQVILMLTKANGSIDERASFIEATWYNAQLFLRTYYKGIVDSALDGICGVLTEAALPHFLGMAGNKEEDAVEALQDLFDSAEYPEGEHPSFKAVIIDPTQEQQHDEGEQTEATPTE